MQTLKHLYVEQLKKSVMNALNHDVPDGVLCPGSIEEQLERAWFEHFWVGDALTMTTRKRMDNLQFCIEDCLAQNVPGDILFGRFLFFYKQPAVTTAVFLYFLPMPDTRTNLFSIPTLIIR